jgi:hypothetical protein
MRASFSLSCSCARLSFSGSLCEISAEICLWIFVRDEFNQHEHISYLQKLNQFVSFLAIKSGEQCSVWGSSAFEQILLAKLNENHA